jgi:hypothetical protein
VDKNILDETLDNLITLFNERPARLAHQNWFPNPQPQDEDNEYKYLYVGSRYVDNHKVFAPFIDTQNEQFTGGIDINKPFLIEYYSLTKFCCFSLAERVMNTFLDAEFDRRRVEEVWLDYGEFYRAVIHNYPKSEHCECASACRCLPAGRVSCRCVPTCTCP